MGRRGKQRAKQAKAAREIKYHTFDTDFSELQRELGSGARDYEDEAGDREEQSRMPSDERDAS